MAGATFFTTLTGFSWSITQWAPFSLVRVHAQGIEILSILTPAQLAEAILTDDGPGNEDAGSIVLEDTRTRQRSGDFALAVDDGERQFLVGSDDEDQDGAVMHTAREEDVQSFSSDASMEEERPTRSRSTSVDRERERARHPLRNLGARTSHLNVHSLADEQDMDGEADGAKPRSGLAAKAGIIIVSISSSGPAHTPKLSVEYRRASTTSSWSFRSLS